MDLKKIGNVTVKNIMHLGLSKDWRSAYQISFCPWVMVVISVTKVSPSRKENTLIPKTMSCTLRNLPSESVGVAGACGMRPLFASFCHSWYDLPHHIVMSHFLDLTINNNFPKRKTALCSDFNPIYLEDGLLVFLRCDNLRSLVYFGHRGHAFWWVLLPGVSGLSLSPNFATYQSGVLGQGTKPLSSMSSNIR